ncbi:MAG: hypothetical protein WCL59_12810 [Cyanobium sp. ELA507]
MSPSPELAAAPPLVLVHGLFDTPRVFDTLRRRLAGRRSPLLVPHLPHALGSVPLEDLAAMLGSHIEAAFGAEQPVDLMGFSMDEMIDYPGIKLAGVGKFLGEAGTSKTTLFI